MKFLVSFFRAVDRLNAGVGQGLRWLILVMVLISAGNALIRKGLDLSSNAFLEIQWYLFSAVFLLGAAYTLSRNAHVRVDVIASRFSLRAQAWMDIFGSLVFLLPMAGLILYFGWPFFVSSWLEGEMSSDAGGLLRWPVKLLLPAGFALLLLQGLAEIAKRIAFLGGAIANPFDHVAHEEEAR